MPIMQAPQHDMTKEQLVGKEPLDRNQVLQAAMNRCVEKLANLDIDIAVLEATDQALVVGQKVMARDPQGNPISTTSVTAKAMLEDKKKDRVGTQLRFDAIEKLMK